MCPSFRAVNETFTHSSLQVARPLYHNKHNHSFDIYQIELKTILPIFLVFLRMSFNNLRSILATATDSMSETVFFESGTNPDLDSQFLVKRVYGSDLKLPLIWLSLSYTESSEFIAMSDEQLVTYNLIFILLLERDTDNSIEDRNRLTGFTGNIIDEFAFKVKRTPIERGRIVVSALSKSSAFRVTSEVLLGRAFTFSLTIPNELDFCDGDYKWCNQDSVI